ncbi:alpha/beta hydrolase family protein [Aldersonia kunmingensis]|uniref:alpha/beta hydrolase family protein n=1 Tax=Aldersonia kunmingensis TaxID=408066 RepID=UPI00082969B4|nr:alpha/beta hydrolase [Aldersonia kunmingensis]
MTGLTSDLHPITGVAAGVPYLAVPPPGGARPDAPVVIGWHLLDPPRTEAAFAAALPLAGLDAWRIYLGLPLAGSRGLPPDEIMRLGYEDVVANLYEPIAFGALAEFPAALAELRQTLRLDASPIGVFGGSMGAAVAQLVVLESEVEVGAAVLISPLIRLADAVGEGEQIWGQAYQWTDASRAVADRLDFLNRAAEFEKTGQPSLHIVIGAEDQSFYGSAHQLRDAVAQCYRDPSRVAITDIAGMGHALADEPGIEPAPQTPHAAEVDRIVTSWFSEHLRPSA